MSIECNDDSVIDEMWYFLNTSFILSFDALSIFKCMMNDLSKHGGRGVVKSHCI